MPKSRAMVVLGTPALTRCRASSIWSSASFRARPLYLPAVLAIRMPSRCRSRMGVRSNPAKAPRRLSVSRPIASSVSRL